MTRRAIAVVAALAVVAAGVWWFSGEEERHARDNCIEYVKGKIADPARAEFTFDFASQNGDTWELSGNADSDRRHRFFCTVRPQGKVDADVY